MLSKKNGCPYLMVAPMEGVGDYSFRKAIASVGGFDEAVREFIRVPTNAHVQSLASIYDPNELSPLPLAAQIMGSDPISMATMAQELAQRGAPRIDVNCGCPSNTVTGRGAGSSLLKDPKSLLQLLSTVVRAVAIPVTVKMRSGFSDISLFNENLFAAQESGVRFITLHPRTKVDGYGPPARWDLIAKAKSLLTIPIVGNGDICNVQDALTIRHLTKCDAIMIGRGSIMNPFIFQQIQAHFSGCAYEPKWEEWQHFFEVFLSSMPTTFSSAVRVNKLKQLFSFQFMADPSLLEKRQHILRTSFTEPDKYIRYILQILHERLK